MTRPIARSRLPAYTTILDWLGMGRNQNRVPIIGLSATPFRGTSEVETERLVKRFGGHRFDDFELTRIPCFGTWEFCRMCVTWSCPVQTLN